MKYFKNKKGLIFIAIDKSNLHYLTGDAGNYEDCSDSEIKKLFKNSKEVSSLSFAAIYEYPFLLLIAITTIIDYSFFKSERELLRELKKFDNRIEKAHEEYTKQLKKLKKRIVLFEEENSSMVSSWSDKLSIEIHGNVFDIYTSVGFNDYRELFETIIDEIKTGSFIYLQNGECIVNLKYDLEFSAISLFEGINEITNDEYCRWEEINWNWDDIIQNLEENSKTKFLVDELKNIVKHEKNRN